MAEGTSPSQLCFMLVFPIGAVSLPITSTSTRWFPAIKWTVQASGKAHLPKDRFQKVFQVISTQPSLISSSQTPLSLLKDLTLAFVRPERYLTNCCSIEGLVLFVKHLWHCSFWICRSLWISLLFLGHLSGEWMKGCLLLVTALPSWATTDHRQHSVGWSTTLGLALLQAHARHCSSVLCANRIGY